MEAAVPVTDAELIPIKIGNTEIERLVANLQVVDTGSHNWACKLEGDIQAQIKLIEEKLKKADDARKKANREFIELKNSLIDPLEAAKAAIKVKIGLWRRNEKARAEEELRVAQAAALKAAEEARLFHAAELEAAGQGEAAMAVLDRPMIAVSVPAQAKIEKHGVATREVWGCEVDNLSELIEWVAADLRNRFQYLLPNESVLRAQAKSAKQLFSIPGCRVTLRDA